MQNAGHVDAHEHKQRVLVARQEITGADRQWAEQYEHGDVVRYTRGSKTHGIAVAARIVADRLSILPLNSKQIILRVHALDAGILSRFVV